MAFRRPTQAGSSSSFNYVLAALTEEIADLTLKTQVRHFAKTMMTEGQANVASQRAA